MRRLLWIHQNFVSARQPGNSRPVQVISALLEQGWTVDLITTQTGYLHDESSPPAQQAEVTVEREGKLTIHRLHHGAWLHSRGRSYIGFLLKTLRYVRRIGQVDMVFASTPPLPHVLLMAVVSVWKRAPMVLEVRDLWPAYLTDLGLLKSTLATICIEWIESFAYRFAEHSVVVTPPLVFHLHQMGILPEKTTVLPTGGDPYYKRIDPTEALAWRKRHGLDDKFVILYAGSFNEQYGIEMALSAAHRLGSQAPEICWVFVGNGRLRRQVEDAAEELECVKYLGSLPKDELMPTIAGADLGLDSLGASPMLHLTMPGKLFDYLAAGIPVISTNDGLPGAMVDAAGAGFVLKEPTVDQLVEAVLRVVALPRDQLARMGRCGQDWILRRINCIDMARSVADVVADVYDRRKGRRGACRMLGAAVGACFDVLSRRSARITKRMIQDDLRQASRDSLDTWLAERDVPSSTTLQWNVPTSPLLSSRDEGNR